jgi:thiol:disulfide interchange protein DsbG
MRITVFIAAAIFSPTMAVALTLGEPPHCALPPPSVEKVSGPVSEEATAPGVVTGVPIEPSDPSGNKEGLSTVDGSPQVSPENVAALNHILQTGAQISDVGISHGLRIVIARHGEQFMLLNVTPDGQAIVAGLQSDLSVSQLLAATRSQVMELGTAHGLRGLFVRNGPQFQVLYATPDGERLIPGVMWDATGKNVTREQVGPIAGAVPTAVIGGNDSAEAPSTGAAVSGLEAVKSATFGTMGQTSAPRLWVFIDPLCSYSVRALQELQPFVGKGRVLLAVIPLSVLDYEDQGRSTTAALAMLSKPSDQMVSAWSHGDLNHSPVAAAQARLQGNMAAAEAIHLRGTPTFIWRKTDGTEGRLDGLPTDWGALIDSIGG